MGVSAVTGAQATIGVSAILSKEEPPLCSERGEYRLKIIIFFPSMLFCRRQKSREMVRSDRILGLYSRVAVLHVNPSFPSPNCRVQIPVATVRKLVSK